jgi:hypothetical protein
MRVRAYSRGPPVQDEHTDPSPDFEALAPRFEALGLSDIAARLRALAQPPAAEEVPRFPLAPGWVAPGDLLTVSQAAAALGLRSHSMVMTMAELGTLEAFSRGDEVVLSRGSVERYRGSATAHQQRRIEEQLFSILSDLDL